jgi:outer membrane protein OmpA-like peptidoglycan-associated protein
VGSLPMNQKNIFARNSIAIALALSLAGCAAVATSVRRPAPEVFAAADLPPPMESIPYSASAPIVEQAAERVAVLPSASGAPVASSGPSYNFGYSVRRAEAAGVERVFDDGYQTYLQFSAPPAADAAAFDAQGNPLIATRHGDYMVVPGVHRSVLVQSGWLYSHVSAGPLDRRAATELPHGAVPAPDGAARLAAAPAQSDEARTRSADAPIRATAPQPMASAVRVELELASKEVEKDQAKALGANATLIRVHFRKGAARLNVSKQTRKALVQAAMQSKRIILNGAAGGTGGATANMTLARARALSAKHMLVGEGVAASKIILSYSAARGRAALKNTKDGRASERRVDFVFVGPGEERIQVARSDGM